MHHLYYNNVKEIHYKHHTRYKYTQMHCCYTAIECIVVVILFYVILKHHSDRVSVYEVTFVCCRVLWEAVDYEPEERALQEVNEPLLSDAIRRYQIIYLTCVRVMIF